MNCQISPAVWATMAVSAKRRVPPAVPAITGVTSHAAMPIGPAAASQMANSAAGEYWCASDPVDEISDPVDVDVVVLMDRDGRLRRGRNRPSAEVRRRTPVGVHG